MVDFENSRNDVFSLAESESRLKTLMVDLVARTSRVGLSISTADVAEIEKMSGSFSRILNDYSQMMLEFAASRRDNLVAFRDVEVVSLGEDCLSRTLATQWGIKKAAKFGEKTSPFDLSVHPLASVHKLIDNDFDGYVDESNLIFEPKSNVCFNTKYNVTFNHEGEKYSLDGFAELKSAYKRRIENLKEALSSDKPILLLVHIANPSEAQNKVASDLLALIQRKWPNSDFQMFVVNTYKFGQPLGSSAAHNTASIQFMDINYPFADYVWHLPAHSFSLEGHDFESKVVAEVKKATLSRQAQQMSWDDAPLLSAAV